MVEKQQIGARGLTKNQPIGIEGKVSSELLGKKGSSLRRSTNGLEENASELVTHFTKSQCGQFRNKLI